MHPSNGNEPYFDLECQVGQGLNFFVLVSVCDAFESKATDIRQLLVSDLFTAISVKDKRFIKLASLEVCAQC